MFPSETHLSSLSIDESDLRECYQQLSTEPTNKNNDRIDIGQRKWENLRGLVLTDAETRRYNFTGATSKFIEKAEVAKMQRSSFRPEECPDHKPFEESI